MEISEERSPHTNLPYPVSALSTVYDPRTLKTPKTLNFESVGVPGLPIHPNANGKNNIEKANDIKH